MASLSRLTIVVALAGLATAARPAIAQQQLPRADALRATGLFYRWPSWVQRRLLIGGDSAKQSPGVTRLQLPELPAGSFARAQTQRWRALPLRDSVTTQCLMPVLRVTRGASDSMPVIKADSTRLEKMPVVRSGCVNPLNRK